MNGAIPVTFGNENHMRNSCLFKKGSYNILKVEKANLSLGRDAKSWVYQPDASRLVDRQAVEVLLLRQFYLRFAKEVNFAKIFVLDKYGLLSKFR